MSGGFSCFRCGDAMTKDYAMCAHCLMLDRRCSWCGWMLANTEVMRVTTAGERICGFCEHGMTEAGR